MTAPTAILLFLAGWIIPAIYSEWRKHTASKRHTIEREEVYPWS